MRAEQIPGPEQSFVLREHVGGVVRLTLNRPDRFNPLSSAMIAALRQRLDEVASDKEARVVVLAAAGWGFQRSGDGAAKRLKGKGPRISALTSMNVSWWRRRELNPSNSCEFLNDFDALPGFVRVAVRL